MGSKSLTKLAKFWFTFITPTMNSSQKEIGLLAEDLAAKHLESIGYEIVERNYRFKRAEIDIIAMKSNLLIFVEVKQRKNSRYGHPEEFISTNQQKQIITAAEDYIYAINWTKNIRYDVIAITGQELTHLEDCFY